MTPEHVQAATRELLELVEARLPASVYIRGEAPWRSAGPALIVRCADLADSMATLADARRPSNVMILLRALYEHVVTFCWLAIDPDPRVAQWIEHSRFWSKKLHVDVARYGHTLLSDGELEAAKAADQLPPLSDRADEVDRYWSKRLPAFRPAGDFLSMRGIYTLYRASSRDAHAQAESVNSCIDAHRYPWVVQRESNPNMLASALGIPMLAMALTVCHARFGWPDADRVRAINDRFTTDEPAQLTRDARPHRCSVPPG